MKINHQIEIQRDCETIVNELITFLEKYKGCLSPHVVKEITESISTFINIIMR